MLKNKRKLIVFAQQKTVYDIYYTIIIMSSTRSHVGIVTSRAEMFPIRSPYDGRHNIKTWPFFLSGFLCNTVKYII